MQKNIDISATIMSITNQRGPEKSTCPSEIARLLFSDNWRSYMKDIVDVAIDLQNQGKIVITQKGLPVNVKHIKGPIRIKIM